MALDKVLKIYDSDSNEVDYDIRATDVKFNDGDSLPDKLAEIEQDVADAGQVNDIKVGNDTYTPTNKTIDLTAPFAAKQDTINDLQGIREGAAAGATALQPDDLGTWAKQPNKPTYTAEEVGALPDDTVIPQGTVKSVTADGNTYQPDGDGNVNIGPIGGDEVSITFPATPDGTFTINVGNNSYIIDLNHLHSQYLQAQVLTQEAYDAIVTKDSNTLYIIEAQP